MSIILTTVWKKNIVYNYTQFQISTIHAKIRIINIIIDGDLFRFRNTKYYMNWF